MSDVNVIADPHNELDLAEVAPHLFETDRVAVRVEPTPAHGKDQIANDLLTSLRRRPHFASRWSLGATAATDAAVIWSVSHGIQHVIISRAHTVKPEPLRMLQTCGPDKRYTDVGPLTWWLIDSSADGALLKERRTLSAQQADPVQMSLAINDDQVAHEARNRKDSAIDDPLNALINDAHPAMFGERLRETLLPSEATVAIDRFHAAADIARSSSAFVHPAHALWYLLSNARSPSDALLVLRGAQLGFLQRRLHTAIASSPWLAALGARTWIGQQAQGLLPYADPITAAIGALAISTAISASYMTSVAADDVRRGGLVLHPGFTPTAGHSIVAAIMQAQLLAIGDAMFREDGKCLLVPPAPKSVHHRVPATISADRVTAMLHEIEIERGVSFSLAGWCGEHGIGWQHV